MHNNIFFPFTVGIHVYRPSNANDLKIIYNLHNFRIFPSYAFRTVLFVLYVYYNRLQKKKSEKKEVYELLTTEKNASIDLNEGYRL